MYRIPLRSGYFYYREHLIYFKKYLFIYFAACPPRKVRKMWYEYFFLVYVYLLAINFHSLKKKTCHSLSIDLELIAVEWDGLFFSSNCILLLLLSVQIVNIIFRIPWLPLLILTQNLIILFYLIVLTCGNNNFTTTKGYDHILIFIILQNTFTQWFLCFCTQFN